MLAFLREANTSGFAFRIFDALDTVLDMEDFNKLFPVILTDNGSEFSNPKQIEYREKIPRRRTNIFYCDAGSPYQKGACEVNYELIRRILPKGTSFDELTQKDVSLSMSYISSYLKKKAEQL
jgi:IS30 family transposase